MTLATKKAVEELERMLSNARISEMAGLEKSSSCPDFVTNADAPPGFSLKRKPSRLEACALRQKAAAAASQTALPFMPLSALKKPLSELGDIQARNLQRGVISSASAMQRSSSAPELPVVSRASPVVADRGESQAHEASAAARQLVSTGSLENAIPVSALGSPSNDNIVQGRLRRTAPRPSRFIGGA